MILYVTRTVTDFGNDTLYDGLCRVLGHKNVLEYPTKDSLHGGKGKRYAQYPCFFDYPTISDEEKIQMLVDGKFDAILIACTAVRDFTREQDGDKYDGFIKLLEGASRKTPTYLIDYGDLRGINKGLWERFNALLYFKREFTKGGKDVIPFNFSYSERYMAGIKTLRDNMFFWAGSFQHYRRKFLEVCVEHFGIDMAKNDLTQSEYREELLRSKIGLSLRGWGFDTVRFYEVPAHGALLLSQKPRIFINNNFEDGKNAVFFETPEELDSKIKFLLDNPKELESIRLKGYNWFTKYHTSSVRAKQLLERI